MNLKPSRILLPALALAAIIVVADQASKNWAMDYLENGARTVDVLPILKLVLVHNEGISFGMLNNVHPHMPDLLIVFSAVITLALLVWLWRTANTLTGVALAILIGGAIGNIIDRLRFGWVIDFIYFHYEKLYWPAFNLADSAVVTGVALLLLQSLAFDKKSRKNSPL